MADSKKIRKQLQLSKVAVGHTADPGVKTQKNQYNIINMKKENSENLSPIDMLLNDIKKFVKELESLQVTLPLMMKVNGMLNKEAHKEYKEFIDKYAISQNNSGDTISFKLKYEDATKSKNIKRRVDNLDNADRLIPRHFIISLISQYDSFLGRILRFLFLMKPEILNSSEKQITYANLLEFSDLESAREFIIEKEIESVIRKSHIEHFNWLSEKLKTPFNKDLHCWSDFIELTERRNLFVHCDGHVSSQYLSICEKNKCLPKQDIKVGDELDVSLKYFQKAYECIFEIGIKLAHVILRKICSDKIDDSDESIIDLTYDLIERKEFNLSINILNFFTNPNVKHKNECDRLVMIINKAQSHKWNGNEEECQKLIKSQDWSACDDRFKIAVATLEEDYEQCYQLMDSLKNNSNFPKMAYSDWPLFQKLRKQNDFPDNYQHCYNEVFATEQKAEKEKNKLEVQGHKKKKKKKNRK